MKKFGKVDANQDAIVAALRATGCSVQSLASLGDGVPDLLVGRNGRNVLLEAKTKGGALTAKQVSWLAKWKGQAAVVRTAAEAIECVNRHCGSNTCKPIYGHISSS